MTTIELPVGIRNLNPGNLRASYGLGKPTVLSNGYARFTSMVDGVQALASLTADYYTKHGFRTLTAFLSHYAPASENDVQAYVLNVCKITGWSPLQAATADMRLDKSWNALILMRAIVLVECGHVPTDWSVPGEWIDLTTWNAAMHRSYRWSVV